MKKTAKDSKKKTATKVKDLSAKKDVKGGTSPRLSDKAGNTGAGIVTVTRAR